MPILYVKEAFRSTYFNPGMMSRHLKGMGSATDAVKLAKAFKVFLTSQFNFMDVQAKSSS